jgi:hypothetical protein
MFGLISGAVRMTRGNGRRIFPLGLLWAVLASSINAPVLKMELEGQRMEVRTAAIFIAVSIVFACLCVPVVTSAHRIVLQGSRGRVGWIFRHEEQTFIVAALRFLGPLLLGVLVLAIAVFGIGLVMVSVSSGQPGDGLFLSAMAVELVLKAALGYWITRYLLIFPAAAVGVTLTSLAFRQVTQRPGPAAA